MSKVICISGKSGSGKDTLANAMKTVLDSHNVSSTIIHYADPVKLFAITCYNWNGVKDETGRSILQHLGTDVIRNVDENYWVDMIGRFIKDMDTEFKVFLIPDTRFPNEIERLEELGLDVTAIRITRYEDDHEYLNPALTDEQHAHPSETSLDKYYCFDYAVANTTLEELQESALGILEDMNLIRKDNDNV